MTTAEPNTKTAITAAPTPAIPGHLQRIVLTGFMGAGKSTIGRLLAARIGWDFLDLDTHLEQRAQSTIPEIFATHGEARFRRLESTALASALTCRNTVIALGGGTPEILTNRLLLEQTPGTATIFLDAPSPPLFSTAASCRTYPPPAAATPTPPSPASPPAPPPTPAAPAAPSTPPTSFRRKPSTRSSPVLLTLCLSDSRSSF